MSEKEEGLRAIAFQRIYARAFDGNNEIFFRELISFSLRALETVPDEVTIGMYDPETHRVVRVVLNSTNKTLTFIHWGIGMSKDDLVDNLGTLGSKGVGFWSAFLVAERVVVTTKHDNGEQYVWESQGGHSFKIAKDTSGESLGSTKITLFLKEDQLEYLDPYRMIDLVAKYFRYIDYKITIWVEESTNKVMTKFVHLSRSNPKRSTWLQKIPRDSPLALESSDEDDDWGKKKRKKRKNKKKKNNRKQVSSSALESSAEEDDGGKKNNTRKQVSFEEKKRQFETLCKVFMEILGRKVAKVVVSHSVVNNLPCYFSGDPKSNEIIMEINSRDPIMDQLREMAHANKNVESLVMTIWLLYGLYSLSVL